jgi:hypothetical protein
MSQRLDPYQKLALPELLRKRPGGEMRTAHGGALLPEYRSLQKSAAKGWMIAPLPSRCVRSKGLLTTGASATRETAQSLLFQCFQVSDATCRGRHKDALP